MFELSPSRENSKAHEKPMLTLYNTLQYLVTPVFLLTKSNSRLLQSQSLSQTEDEYYAIGNGDDGLWTWIIYSLPLKSTSLYTFSTSLKSK